MEEMKEESESTEKSTENGTESGEEKLSPIGMPDDKNPAIKPISKSRLVLMSIFAVVVSGLVRALGIYMFSTPNEFAPGGVNGVAVLLQTGIGWSSGYFLLMLNVPLFFVSFFWIGKKEAIVSTASIFISSGLLILLETLFPNGTVIQYRADGDIASSILAAIASGIFLGVALAMMVRTFGTSGGTTILATLVNRKFKNISVSLLTSAFDACVVFASFFVYHRGAGLVEKLNPVFLALISLFVTTKICDAILQGFKSAYKFEIITDKPEEIAKEIMQITHHSVTKIAAEGMYSRKGKSVLMCIIRKRQIANVQRIIKKYPGTFAYFVPVSEVYGRFTK